jgi:hypothetical protein
LVLGAESEEGLEGRHRGAAAVVAEDVFVEVDLQVLVRDAAVGAMQPRLEVEMARWARGNSHSPVGAVRRV